MPETITCANEAEWLSRRTESLGASESSAALGEHPWKSPFELWAEKTGQLPPPDLSHNEAVEFGIRLERPIGEAFADRFGRNVEPHPPYTILKHAETPFLSATLDATQAPIPQHEGRGVLEIKTAGAFVADEWKDGKAPLGYQVQIQQQMAVAGLSWGTLCVLIGGQKLRHIDIEFDEGFWGVAVVALREFWDCVESRNPPPIDGSVATARALAKLHPEDNGETVELPEEAKDWAEIIKIAKAQEKAISQDKRDAENKIKAAIGDATYGVLPDGSRFSFKTQTRKAHEVKESTFRVLRRMGGKK